MSYTKYFICFFFLSCFAFSQDKAPISYIAEPLPTNQLDMTNFTLSKSKASTSSLLSLAVPGLGSHLVSSGDHGRKTRITSVVLALMSISSKLISNKAYDDYKKMDFADYQNDVISAKYDEANLANYVFLGSASAYFTLGIIDLIDSRKYFKRTTISRFN